MGSWHFGPHFYYVLPMVQLSYEFFCNFIGIHTIFCYNFFIDGSVLRSLCLLFLSGIPLVLLKSVRNIIAPPMVIVADSKEMSFKFPTRFKSHTVSYQTFNNGSMQHETVPSFKWFSRVATIVLTIREFTKWFHCHHLIEPISDLCDNNHHCHQLSRLQKLLLIMGITVYSAHGTHLHIKNVEIIIQLLSNICRVSKDKKEREREREMSSKLLQ